MTAGSGFKSEFDGMESDDQTDELNMRTSHEKHCNSPNFAA
jgi:hypothetical protein